MKNISINEIPVGATVLIALDDGTGIVNKAHEISLFKYDGDGSMNLGYPDDVDIIIRVRCANAESGYWVPLEIKTCDMKEDSLFEISMKEDRFLN